MINSFFFKNLSITQGRHLPIIKKQIQLFPAEKWHTEMNLLKKTNLKFIEWVVSLDNFKKNPITKLNGYRIIKKKLKKNNIKIRSVDLDFVIKKPPYFMNHAQKIIFEKKIVKIINNCNKLKLKYINFPFLEKATPDTDKKKSFLLNFFTKIFPYRNKNIYFLIETDLNPKDMLKFIKTFNKKLFINYDTGNSASKNFDFNEEKKYFKYVKNIHLKDRKKNGPTVRFGKGDVNFDKFFKYIKKHNKFFDFNLQPARSITNQHIEEILTNINFLKKVIFKK
jgi:sugar phosphate isomerase/epimerase